MKYRKRPVVIEAFRLGQDTFPPWATGKFNDYEWTLEIDTLEGTMIANKGDWVIKGTHGEIYPCKHEIFIATYEPVE